MTDGPRLDILDRLAPDAFVVSPAHQYPSGQVMAPERRSALVAWARRHDRLIIEDDYDAENRYDRMPIGALQGLDPEHVIHAGTASKVLAPGLRIGWLSLPAELVDSAGGGQASCRFRLAGDRPARAGAAHRQRGARAPGGPRPPRVSSAPRPADRGARPGAARARAARRGGRRPSRCCPCPTTPTTRPSPPRRPSSPSGSSPCRRATSPTRTRGRRRRAASSSATPACRSPASTRRRAPSRRSSGR